MCSLCELPQREVAGGQEPRAQNAWIDKADALLFQNTFMRSVLVVVAGRAIIFARGTVEDQSA
jgi:hypothetical protein